MIGLQDRILERKLFFMSRHAKNIMKEAGMEMRKWISNDTVLMAQWAAEGFDTHPMDASIRLGTNKTKVLGMAWQTLDDCLTLDTKDNLRIPRLVLDSTNDEVSDLIEIHIFCDASKLAYGAAAYVKMIKGIIRVGGRLKHSRLPYSSKHPILLPAKRNSKFSYEELLTLITQIEAILNSRPLTPLSSDVDDLEVLTPAHFLIGRPITAIVEPSLLQCESNRLNVWQQE
ncbi:DUF5641 domain-containing protein [Trichonephila clavipes]|nr:DUF5641 domain-containing protein [Trichonephila clavipes]